MSNRSLDTEQSQPAIAFENQDQALSIFQFYENKGFADKQQMMTMVTWLTAFVFSLLGYCAVSIFGDKPFSGISVSLAGWAALVLSAYAVYMVYEFLDHAEKNYEKADQIVQNIGTLSTQTRNLMLSKRGQEPILRLLRGSLGWHRVGRVFIILLLWSIIICVLSVVTIVTVETR